MPSRNLLNIQLSVIEKYLHRTPSQGRPTLQLGGTCGTRHVGRVIYGTSDMWNCGTTPSRNRVFTLAPSGEWSYGLELWRGKDAPRADFNYAEIVAFAKFIISGQRMESMLV